MAESVAAAWLRDASAAGAHLLLLGCCSPRRPSRRYAAQQDDAVVTVNESGGRASHPVSPRVQEHAVGGEGEGETG